uniref:Uncharacterized protein n=1 Tax=uncultured Verrucomicrobiota bacterium TaxID=156588 RepID=D2DXW2_9BACT|nr:hypothetical protein [uncultured Verrucomicrobiota bacterium]
MWKLFRLFLPSAPTTAASQRLRIATLKLLQPFLLIAAVCFVVVAVLPKLMFPSGLWFRKVVRDHPLVAPILITSIQGDTLVAGQRQFRLAGVKLPTDPVIAALAQKVLQIATAQGVEVIRVVEAPDACILRCEPRIWHWCGNDPVAAHFQQFNLNELMVAGGGATYDASCPKLTDEERLRLQAAEKFRREAGAHDQNWLVRGSSLNVSATMILDGCISVIAYELREGKYVSPKSKGE